MRILFRGSTAECVQILPYAIALYRKMELHEKPRQLIPMADGYNHVLIDVPRNYLEINVEANAPPP